MKIYTNELGHMTNMAAMPMYGKILKRSSSPEPIDQCLKLGMLHRVWEYYQNYSNYVPGLTLIHFTLRSNLVT